MENTTTETGAGYDPAALPAPVPAYLDARDEHRHADAAAVCAPDATVGDDGNTDDGRDALTGWVERSSAESTYTATRVGQTTGAGRADGRVRRRHRHAPHTGASSGAASSAT